MLTAAIHHYAIDQPTIQRNVLITLPQRQDTGTDAHTGTQITIHAHPPAPAITSIIIMAPTHWRQR